MGSKTGGVLSLLSGLLAGILCVVWIFSLNRFVKPEIEPDAFLDRYTSLLNVVLIPGIFLGLAMATIGVINIAVKGNAKLVFGIMAILVDGAFAIITLISWSRVVKIYTESDIFLYMIFFDISIVSVIGAFTPGLVGGILSIITGRGEQRASKR